MKQEASVTSVVDLDKLEEVIKATQIQRCHFSCLRREKIRLSRSARFRSVIEVEIISIFHARMVQYFCRCRCQISDSVFYEQ